MFKDFADDWLNCDAPIVIHIALVAVLVFHDRHDGPTLKLSRNMSMEQHRVGQSSDPL